MCVRVCWGWCKADNPGTMGLSQCTTYLAVNKELPPVKWKVRLIMLMCNVAIEYYIVERN